MILILLETEPPKSYRLSLGTVLMDIAGQSQASDFRPLVGTRSLMYGISSSLFKPDIPFHYIIDFRLFFLKHQDTLFK